MRLYLKIIEAEFPIIKKLELLVTTLAVMLFDQHVLVSLL